MARFNTIIYLSDLIRAFETLQPADDSTRRAITTMLGLRREESLPNAPAKAPTPPEISPTQPAATIDTLKQGPEHNSVSTSTQNASTPIPRSSNPVLSTIERSAGEGEPWNIDVVPLQLQTTSEEFTEPPPLLPLFVPLWTRGILSAALTTDSEDGQLDLESIAESLAHGECIGQLPRLPWPTLRRGVQVLVDKSDALVPFTRDQTWLQEEIRRVVGVDRVQILRFVGCPSRAVGTGPRKSWDKYRPPPSGTVVLLLTDLGIGMPMFATEVAEVSEWLEFAKVVHRANCPLVAFVPYAPSRWPRHLIGAMTIIQWDRGTSAATISDLVRRGHEVGE